MKTARRIHHFALCVLACTPLAMTLASCAATGRADVDIANDVPGESNRVFVRGPGRQDVPYKLYLPPGYDDPSGREAWPLLVFLHGAGERGDDLERVAIHGPIGRARKQPMPFVIVSPLCPKGRSWRNEELVDLIDHCLARYFVDERRVLLTGLSMGGYGTFALGLTHPEKFAAIVPICGGGERLAPFMLDDRGKAALRSLQVRVYHGADDRVVPIEESLRMVHVLEELGVPVEMTTYQGVGHAAWKPAYADEELWRWLEERHR
ncbi:MAG: prolyl oligopeptidase family serine peptidase [Planctomycetes bacterium]|nr:prolyl oligopeptidase family serine peptidase [Planctomycetota bacterium]